MSSLNLLAQSNTSGGGSAISLVILLLIPAGLYFILLRPQRRRMKDQQALQAGLGMGDEVITTSGIFGFISAVEDTYFWLEIDDDVQIRILKGAVQSKAPSPDEQSADDADKDES